MAGGLATLGDIVFRINPDDINWNYVVNTNVEETVGGRVVQILGATLSDITIRGHYGQNQGRAGSDDNWQLAEAFVQRVRMLMYQQAVDANQMRKMQPPIPFAYPPYFWKFDVYILSLTDLDGSGGSVNHRTGKFNYGYELKLFPVEDSSADPVGPGKWDYLPSEIKDSAIEAYIGRISDGLGWKMTGFNDPTITLDILGKDIGGGNPGPINNTQPATATPSGSKTPTTPTSPADKAKRIAELKKQITKQTADVANLQRELLNIPPAYKSNAQYKADLEARLKKAQDDLKKSKDELKQLGG